MTEEDWDEVYKLKNELYKKLNTEINMFFVGITPKIEDEIRQQLNDEFRFWKCH